jgi:hypothetical protein
MTSKTLDKKTTIPILAVMAAVLIFGSMSAAHATNTNAPPGAKIVSSCANPPGVTAVTGPSSFGGLDDWNCLFTKAGKTSHSWDDTGAYAISNSSPFAWSVKVSVADCCFVGDFYQVWRTNDGVTWTTLMTSPAVHTDGTLVAPAFNVLWDGTGTTYSAKTSTAIIPAGTFAVFYVQDPHFGQIGSKLDVPCGETTALLITAGCSVAGISVAPGWSPAGFTLSFA